MEIHGHGETSGEKSGARFSVMQFSLKDEHKIPGYDTYRVVFNDDPSDRSEESCEKLRPLLETVDSFHLLLSDQHMMMTLCRALKLVTIPWGGVNLMREGDAGDCMYFVLAGRFNLSVRGKDGKSHNVGISKCGNTIGEVALREEGFRNATVTSAEASELLRIGLEDYNELLRHNDKNHDHNRKVNTLQKSPALSKLRLTDMEEMAKRTFFQTFRAARNPIQDTVQRECFGTNFSVFSLRASGTYGERPNRPVPTKPRETSSIRRRNENF